MIWIERKSNDNDYKEKKQPKKEENYTPYYFLC